MPSCLRRKVKDKYLIPDSLDFILFCLTLFLLLFLIQYLLDFRYVFDYFTSTFLPSVWLNKPKPRCWSRSLYPALILRLHLSPCWRHLHSSMLPKVTVSEGTAVTASLCHLGDGFSVMEEVVKQSGRVTLTQQGARRWMPSVLLTVSQPANAGWKPHIHCKHVCSSSLVCFLNDSMIIITYVRLWLCCQSTPVLDYQPIRNRNSQYPFLPVSRDCCT